MGMDSTSSNVSDSRYAPEYNEVMIPLACQWGSAELFTSHWHALVLSKKVNATRGKLRTHDSSTPAPDRPRCWRCDGITYYAYYAYDEAESFYETGMYSHVSDENDPRLYLARCEGAA